MVAGVSGVESWAAPLFLRLAVEFRKPDIVIVLSIFVAGEKLAPPGLHPPRGALLFKF